MCIRDRSQQELGNIFNNPQFQQLRQMILQNPALLQTLMQQWQQTNPALYNMISQNQGAFLQALLQGPQGGSGGAGAGGIPPGASVISVTQEEKAAIDRLVGLGFTKQAAIEAYLACDKNEELAANYLLESQFQDEQEDALNDLQGGQNQGGSQGGNQQGGGQGGNQQGGGSNQQRKDDDDENLFQ
eukprot:TRINITY_DN224_c0_g1_i4.p2 TRINITY_DN224_c0_g1~~TRINITY_DN224_c0_g1_i4.p2  ORF type:complete len:186 (+),score=59.00 TRINITY_DN224_c0_g1_i4:74-631(+)